MGTLEEHVTDQIAGLEQSLAGVDEVFGNLDSVEYDEVTKNMTPLERAKYDLTNLYAINSLFWMYMRSFGENPQNMGIKGELDRIKKQMLRVKQITDKVKMPRIDKDAAKRMVKHELWQPGQPSGSNPAASTATSSEEPENWGNAEPMDTDARGQKRKFSETKSGAECPRTNTGLANMPSSDSDEDEDSDASESNVCTSCVDF